MSCTSPHLSQNNLALHVWFWSPPRLVLTTPYIFRTIEKVAKVSKYFSKSVKRQTIAGNRCARKNFWGGRGLRFQMFSKTCLWICQKRVLEDWKCLTIYALEKILGGWQLKIVHQLIIKVLEACKCIFRRNWHVKNLETSWSWIKYWSISNF